MSEHPLRTWRVARGVPLRVLLTAASSHLGGAYARRMLRADARLVESIECGLAVPDYERARLARLLAPVVPTEIVASIRGEEATR